MSVNSGLAQLTFETVPLSKLGFSPNNPRRYPKRVVKTAARLIRECGFVLPILVDERFTVVHGEPLLRAAQELELATVPIVQATHLTDEQKRLLTVALDRLGELGEWDRDQLAHELTFLSGLYEPELIGFEMGEIDLALAVDDERHQDTTADDRCPAVVDDQRSVTRQGDLWALGDHRLVCGDARAEETLVALIASDRVCMVLTDPPYNVPIAGHVSGKGRVRHREFPVASGELTDEAFGMFLEAALRSPIRHLKDGAVLYVFMDWRHLHDLTAVSRRVGFELLNLCVWNKTNGGMGSLYRSKHELVLVLKHGRAPHRNNVNLGRSGRNRTNVWDYAGVNTFRTDRGSDLAMHPTTKPVAMLADAIKDVTVRRDVILDPFCGSGSTIIAAERTGRQARAVELDPLYVDVAVRRWQALTGKKAMHVASGMSFEDVAAERALISDSHIGEVIP